MLLVKVNKSGSRSNNNSYRENNLIKLIQNLEYWSSYNLKDIIKLIRTRNRTVVPLLIKALKDPCPNIRRGAARILGHRGEKDAVMPLIECLNDPDEYVRATAANSLKSLKDPRAVEALIKCLSDSPSAVRRSAAIALGSISSSEAKEALENAAINNPDLSVRKIAKVFLTRGPFINE